MLATKMPVFVRNPGGPPEIRPRTGQTPSHSAARYLLYTVRNKEQRALVSSSLDPVVRALSVPIFARLGKARHRKAGEIIQLH
jgi:hypothetical protein